MPERLQKWVNKSQNVKTENVEKENVAWLKIVDEWIEANEKARIQKVERSY